MANIGGFGYLTRRNRSCFVYGCFSTAANKPHLGFHKLPSSGTRNIVVVKKNGDKCIYDRRQIWIDALNIGREAALVLEGINVYVCSLHFSRDDFYYNQDFTGRRYLKEFAIPRRNLPARSSSHLTTKFNVRSLNRLKHRGYFSIHNPDGRKLTARRSFLGSSKLNNGSTNQSYTKTVWVVKKPVRNPEQPTQIEELDNDDQCTIVSTEVGKLNSNNPFTSELIIKEEPVSDAEQEPTEGVEQMVGDENQKMSNDEYNDDDGNYFESDKLTEEEEEQKKAKPVETDNLDQGEVEEIIMGEENLDEIDEYNAVAGEEGEEESEQVEEYNPSADEEEEAQLGQIEEYNEMADEEFEVIEENDPEYYNYNEETNGSNEEDEPELLYDEDEEYPEEDYEGGLCHICGSEDCDGNHDSHMKENLFVCLICSEIFPSQKLLVDHSAAHHDMSEEEVMMNEDKNRSLTCEFCGRVLSTKCTLREHIMIHTGEKPHECMLCGKSFRHKANLVVHVNSHAVVSTYNCRKCNKAFTKKMDFEKHLQYHVDSAGNPLVCTICNAVFKSQRTLYNHSQLHTRNGAVRAKKRSEKPREPTFKCKICGKGLSTKATLKEHMMIHTGERPHVCNICGRSIRHKANYVVHIQTHGQGKSFECDMCDEAFMRKSDLTQHKQAEHSKSKLLRCPICGEVFKSPQKFNRHMEIHESVVYMNETEELMMMDDGEELSGTGFQPHLLEGFLDP